MSRAPRFAAIDIGSNTVHLMVASCPPQRLPIPLLRRRAFVQLGRDVAAVRAIGPERLELALRALHEQVDEARRAGVESIALGATQALRAASNGAEVAARMTADLGAGPVRVLDPQAEAQLAFWGATMAVSPGRQTMVVDIGGASAQIAWGPAGGRCRHNSLPLGSGTLAGLAASDPPTAAEWRAMERRLAELMPDLVPISGPAAVLGTGGTITNLPRLLGRGRGTVMPLRQVEVLVDSFRQRSAGELSQRSGVDLERVRLCRGGVLILAQLMDLMGLRSIRSSERGLRDGMIAALVLRGERWWSPEEVEGGGAGDARGAELVGAAG